MAHVEYLEHFLPIGAAFIFDQLEQCRNWEQVVFDDMHVLGEVQHFGLTAAAAMHHAFDGGFARIEYRFNQWRIGSCGR